MKYGRPMRSPFSDGRTAFLLTAPGVLVMLFSIIAPLALSLYYSLTDWAGFGGYRIVGFENYLKILSSDATFWISLANALVLMLVTVFIQNPIAFTVAAVLARVGRGSRLFRTIYFIPAILSVVVVTKLWVNIFNPSYGLLNKLLKGIGLESLATSWLSNPSTALGSVVFIIVWYGFGWALLFYYSGLMTVPKELEEAARIDGASSFQFHTSIVIPYMLPVIQAVVVIAVISSLKQMEVIYLSTDGAPGDRTQFIANYLYSRAFNYSQYGYGNAISVLFVAFAVALTRITQKFTDRRPETE